MQLPALAQQKRVPCLRRSQIAQTAGHPFFASAPQVRPKQSRDAAARVDRRPAAFFNLVNTTVSCGSQLNQRRRQRWPPKAVHLPPMPKMGKMTPRLSRDCPLWKTCPARIRAVV